MSESKVYGSQVASNENAGNKIEEQLDAVDQKAKDFDREAYDQMKNNLRMRKEAKERLLNQGLPEFKAYLRFWIIVCMYLMTKWSYYLNIKIKSHNFLEVSLYFIIESDNWLFPVFSAPMSSFSLVEHDFTLVTEGCDSIDRELVQLGQVLLHFDLA